MPNLTNAYKKAYNAIRTATQAKPSKLRLYDDEGVELGTIGDGWFSEEVRDETSGQRVVEIRITDRTCGPDFRAVVFLGFSGVKYERTSAPNPPVNNPREWIFRAKPIGTDDQC